MPLLILLAIPLREIERKLESGYLFVSRATPSQPECPGEFEDINYTTRSYKTRRFGSQIEEVIFPGGGILSGYGT